MFDPVQAQMIASENSTLLTLSGFSRAFAYLSYPTVPESTATGHQSTITSGGGATSIGGTVPSPSAGTPSNKTSSGSNAGAIAGGVVGGIVALLVLGLLAFWFIRKRNNANRTPPSAEFSKRYSIDGTTAASNGPPMAQPWQTQPAPVLYVSLP